MIERQIGGWTLVTDRGLMAKLKFLRSNWPSAETGRCGFWGRGYGQSIVYIAITIPSTPKTA